MEEKEKQEESVKKEGPNKISYPEIVLITPMLLFIDLLDIIKTFLEGSIIFTPLALFLGALGLFSTAIVQIYLLIKGVKNFYFLIGGIIDSFPLISFLPTRTAAWIVTVYLFNKKARS